MMLGRGAAATERRVTGRALTDTAWPVDFVAPAHHGVRKGRRTTRLAQTIVPTILFLLFVAAIYATRHFAMGRRDWFLGIYGTFAVTYLAAKMALAIFYRPRLGPPPIMGVSVVIPFYNEKPINVIRTVWSVLTQDYPVKEVIVIDDGSVDPSTYDELVSMRDRYGLQDRLILHRFEENRGKRNAQALGFECATGDVIVTVDSDTTLYPDAIRNLLVPFRDPDVMAVTGHVGAKNRSQNLLTRLIDQRYQNAFRTERAAQSVFGTVLVCSGPLSAYRREVVIENLERYLSQTFLGRPVQYGDDRCLTNYALERGKTVYQSTARCLTEVPPNLKKFIKQQIRWNKSFFRESLVALRIAISRRKPVLGLFVSLELALWLVFGASLLLAVAWSSRSFGAVMALYYLAMVALSAYARSVTYAVRHPVTFLLAPLYALLHVTVLVPIRLYALLTIRRVSWGTR